MHCPSSTRGAPRCAALALTALVPCAVSTGTLWAQSGTSPPVPQTPQQQSALSPYRAPSIALVQPPAGGTVPQDRPVVVFRFVQGEPGDLVDARSFAVSVDGTDRSALFQLAASAMGGEAWGPLVAAAEISSGNLAPGAHQVTARICSARGACASANATVTVLPTPAAGVTSAASHPPTGRKQKLLDALIAVGKRLLREP